jgi:lipopolysaccharide transport system permease protein
VRRARPAAARRTGSCSRAILRHATRRADPSHQTDEMLRQIRADAREALHEVVDYRELLYSMTWRDVLLRYKQTAMGFGWAVLMPVANMLIFTVIFTRVAHLDTGVPYPIYAFAGLLPWNLFASSLRFSVSSLTSNTDLVTKIYFPREVFPFSAVAVCFVDFLIGSLVMVGLMIYYHVAPGWGLLFLPVVLLVLLMFTAAMALLLAMGNLFFRDVKYLIEIVITVWMFATSVVYPVDRVGGTLGMILQLNPMTPIIDGFRAVVLRGELPAAGPFTLATLTSAVLLAVAWLTFHRAEFRFAENI